MTERTGRIGSLRSPRRVALGLERGLRALADVLERYQAWMLSGIALGGLSFGLGWLIGWSPAALLTATLLMPLVLAAAMRDSLGRALAIIGGCFLVRSGLMIFLSVHDFDAISRWFPAGARYWTDEQHPWIATGVNQEYHPDRWLPAHLQLLAAIVIFTYTSWGVIPFWQGLYEADLMNVYVGQLLVHSHSPWPILAVGWHPWSLCRGFGYVALTFEVASLSLSRLLGVPLSTPARRWQRWALGLGLLLLDVIIKYTASETVRQILANNLMR